MKFDKAFAQKYIGDLLKKYKIEVHAISKTSSGHAKWKKRSIKIPVPTSIDRFGVCLHEIKHILDGNKGSRFQQEFACDKYALDILIELGYETDKWIQRMKWHSLSRIAMSHNRGLNHDKIGQEIRDFFPEIDFSKWMNKKVYVGHAYYMNPVPENIQLTVNMSRDQIEAELKKQDKFLEKSIYDDSSYGKWIVYEWKNGIADSRTEWDNLIEIINYYKLAI